MDSSDSEIPDVNSSVNIQPYQFEPINDEINNADEENTSTDESDIDEMSQDNDRLLNTNWFV